ncbi:MAG: hypothetical protein QOC71_1165, partial [Thermoplasmata archaeon]|nr:hypothetical protein [Thermoplasmata archaeon]
GGVWRGMARILGLEAVAAAPTVAVLAFDLRFPAIVVLAAACLATGYLLLRMPGARPVEEGAWLGLGIGGGLGLANAMVTHDVAGVCFGIECGTDSMLWLRSWLIAVVACSGIGLAAGFLAQYDRHHQDLRSLRDRRGTAAAAGQHRFARLK